jgi:hypothetical protein
MPLVSKASRPLLLVLPAMLALGALASRAQESPEAPPVKNAQPPLRMESLTGPAPRDPSPELSREPGPSSRAREHAHASPDDPIEALGDPLSAADADELRTLALELGAQGLTARDAAATKIHDRFGARAAPLLYLLATRDLDPERRFRERALVSSLVFGYYLTRAPDCGWLGVRWASGGTQNHYFSAHVVESIPGQPAYDGGVRTNDEVVAWNGDVLDDQLDFIDHVQAQAPGSTADLTVDRAGVEVHLAVVMGTRRDGNGKVELPYPTFKRDMATRKLRAWLVACSRLANDH